MSDEIELHVESEVITAKERKLFGNWTCIIEPFALKKVKLGTKFSVPDVSEENAIQFTVTEFHGTKATAENENYITWLNYDQERRDWVLGSIWTKHAYLSLEESFRA